MQENIDQKKLRIWTLFTQSLIFLVARQINIVAFDCNFILFLCFLKKDIYLLILSFMLKNLQILMKIKSKFIDCVYFVQTAHLYSSIIITLVNYFFSIVKQLLST